MKKPVLENPRSERFAAFLAQGSTLDEAYREAGYKPNRHNAAFLARKPEVKELGLRVFCFSHHFGDSLLGLQPVTGALGPVPLHRCGLARITQINTELAAAAAKAQQIRLGLGLTPDADTRH
jgi:hypothetical protein